MDNNEFLAGGQKTPSVSWRDVPVGTVVSGTIAREPRTMQSRDIDDGSLEWWDAPANTQPKMQMAIYLDTGTVHPDPAQYPDHDGVWALYVRQSTQMHKQLREAIRLSGAKGLDIGGRLTVTYIGNGEHKDPVKARKYNPPKLYRVEYQPPVPKATQDFLGPTGFAAGGLISAPATASHASLTYTPQAHDPARGFTASSNSAPAGLDPTAWSSLDDARKASILAQMSVPGAGAGEQPPF